MWRLRRAEPGDLPALGELESLCFSDAWSEGAIASHMRSDTGYTLLCEEDGAPIGALFLSCLPPEGEVYRLCVLPAARRRGIGRALMERGLSDLYAAGVRHMYLDVRAGNLPAQQLYRALGFVVCGRRSDYYRAPREDAVLMEREMREDALSGN